MRTGLVPGPDLGASRLRAERASNWLPAPAGKVILVRRLYRPTEAAPSILDGSWATPGVTKLR